MAGPFGNASGGALILVLGVGCLCTSSAAGFVLTWYKNWLCQYGLCWKGKKQGPAPGPAAAGSIPSGAAPQGTAAVGTTGSTNISFYGQNGADDNGEGSAGVDLFKHGTAGITFRGRPVYPVAVHQSAAAKMLYTVVDIKGAGIQPILGHVIDYCDAKAPSCNNYKKNGMSFLVDIHKTGFAAAGKSDGILTGTYTVVGVIRPSQLPKSVWMPKVQDGKDSMLCSCTVGCSGKTQNWKLLKDCA